MSPPPGRRVRGGGDGGQVDVCVAPHDAARCVPGHGAFQEYNATSRSLVAFPPTLLWEKAPGWIVAPGRADVDIEMGFKLRRTFLEAGLPEPGMALGAPVGGGPLRGDTSLSRRR